MIKTRNEVVVMSIPECGECGEREENGKCEENNCVQPDPNIVHFYEFSIDCVRYVKTPCLAI